MSLAARRRYETQPRWVACANQIRSFLNSPAFRAPEAPKLYSVRNPGGVP